jgi:MFS family permease
MKTTQPEKPSYFKNLCSCFRRKKSGDINTLKSENKDGVYRTLLRDPIFIVILMSNASTAIGFTNFTILLPAYAISLGFDKNKASYLLSIVSAFDLVGRIGGSALSDWLPINKKCYYIGGLLFAGISLVLLPLASEYASLAFFCGMFGLSSGTNVGITAIIMVDLLGEDRLASSYGISLFINGIIQLIGPPICGVAFVAINSYGPIISSLGLFLVSGATVWLYFPFVNRNKKEQSLA